MGNALPKTDLEGFLAWEEAQTGRHEFVRGEVYAMVGGRRIHNQVVGNVFFALKGALRGTRCRPFAETTQVLTPAGDLLYPDLFVTCDPEDLRTERIFRHPTLVVEVMSPSTQAYDRGLKFTLYRSIPSVMEVVLIDPDSRDVHLFRRGADGLFTLHDLTGAPQMDFASVGCGLSTQDLFEGAEPAAGEAGNA